MNMDGVTADKLEKSTYLSPPDKKHKDEYR